MAETETLRKITVHVPAFLLEEAQEFTGDGITKTVTAGLAKLTSSGAYGKIRQLRGSCKTLDIDISASRADRDLS
ncbi:MAG: hypothetical protein AAF065_13280 [Verrucomicrobiota bacterium]